MHSEIQARAEKFRKNVWPSSPAAQLLLPNPAMPIELQKSEGNWAAVAYCAYVHGALPRLDQLLTLYPNWHPSFLSRVREDWLSQPAEKRRCASHNVTSALVECAVADYLKNAKGYKIIGMEALCPTCPDIAYVAGSNMRAVEVKYIPDSPEWYNLRKDAASSEDGTAFRWTPDQYHMIDYVHSRIAEAAAQLQDFPISNREVWIVFDTLAATTRSWLQQDSHDRWHGNLESTRPTGFPPGTKPVLLDKPPITWIRAAGCVQIASLQNWSLTEVQSLIQD